MTAPTPNNADSEGIVFTDEDSQNDSVSEAPLNTTPTSEPESTVASEGQQTYQWEHNNQVGTTDEQPVESPLQIRHWVASLLLLVVSDITIYSGNGFAGLGLLFVAAPILILAGSTNQKWLPTLTILCMLCCCAVRAMWLGNVALAICGFILIVAVSLTASGFKASLANVISQIILAPMMGLAQLLSSRPQRFAKFESLQPTVLISIILPVFAVAVFGAIFVFANPSLFETVSNWLDGLLSNDWLLNYMPTGDHVFFWAFAGLFAIGLIKPLSKLNRVHSLELFRTGSSPKSVPDESTCKYFEAYRNTLMSLIVLFGLYLIFEFSTLWFREFPSGFYYAGYAHSGAAWLTFALILASVTLSVMFQRELYADPRIKQIWQLAAIWIALNFILAIAVYNRMWIYVDFNGLTFMRIIGLFGMSTVVVGLVLVIVKMRKQESFQWLVEQDIKALFIAVLAFSLTPVNSIWVSYNVARVNQGDLPPSVQLAAHPIDDDGTLPLIGLLDHENEKIREGVKGILQLRHQHLKALNESRKELGWTAKQWCSESVEKELSLMFEENRLHSVVEENAASTAKQRFFDYAYQWY